MGQSKSPRRCRNCGHDVDHHTGPACARCRHGRRCSGFRAPGAFIICLRFVFDRANEWTSWRSAAEAIAAERELCHPCGPKCQGVHIIVVYDGDGRPHIVPTEPPPPTLDEQLERCYPHPPPEEYRPESWPTPDEFNEPLEPAPTPSFTGQRIQRGQTISLLRQLARVGGD